MRFCLDAGSPLLESVLTLVASARTAVKDRSLLRGRRSLLLERDNQRQRADELYLENLQRQKELWQYPLSIPENCASRIA